MSVSPCVCLTTSSDPCPYREAARGAGRRAEPLPSRCLVLGVILSFRKLGGWVSEGEEGVSSGLGQGTVT